MSIRGCLSPCWQGFPADCGARYHNKTRQISQKTRQISQQVSQISQPNAPDITTKGARYHV